MHVLAKYADGVEHVISIAPNVDMNLQDLKAAIAPDAVSITPYTPPTTTALAAKARDERNDLLAASDWTQVADAPVDQAAWATYRQALRDITAQAGFPEQINWPEAP